MNSKADLKKVVTMFDDLQKAPLNQYSINLAANLQSKFILKIPAYKPIPVK